MFLKFLDQIVNHVDLVLVQRSRRRLALGVGSVVLLGEGIRLKLFKRHLRIMVLVMFFDDSVDNFLNFGPRHRGLNQARCGDILQVKLDECGFQLVTTHLKVVILVVLLELVVHLFDVVEFLGNALEFVEVDFSVLASRTEGFLVERFLEVGQRARTVKFAQGSVCATGCDRPTAIPVLRLKKCFKFRGHT